MKDVAIVILNWNGRDLLEKFLPSVLNFSGDARIVVADNASTDESIAFLKKQHPEIDIIQNDSNGGFAKGYNDALKRVNAKYYVLLNSDVMVTENWLSTLLDIMKDPSVAAVQPKIRAEQNRKHFEYAGACGGFIDKDYFPFCRGRLFETVEEDHAQYDTVEEVFWVSGACMLIRSEVYHKVGGFDEDFFAHMEEIDLCWRMKNLNYRLLVEPRSIVYHVGGATLSYSSPRKVYLNFKNSLAMIFKNHKGALFFKLFWRMSLDGIAALRFLTKGEFKPFWSVFKSHMWLYGNLGTLRKKRRKVQANTSIFNDKGIYRKSIVWQHYARSKKFFSQLDHRFFR